MSAAALQVTTNSIPGSRIAVELEIPAERCQSSYDEALSRLSKSIKLPGFRQGKVPKAVVLQQIGVNRIKATALEALLESVWREAITQESIEPLSEPELNGGFEEIFKNFNPKEKLKITLETDIAPSPKLITTEGLEAEAKKETFDKKKVDELIDQSRKQLATLIPVENRKAAKGDIAVVSFTGTYEDGEKIEGGSSDSLDIDLEEGQMIPGFIEGIIGMDINDEKTLKCQFPDDYSQEEARGKKANFKVILKDLKTRELPELDDSFAQQAGEKATLKELREDLEKRLKSDLEQRNKNNRKEALINALVKQLDVEIPKSLIDQEVRILVEQTAQKFAQQGIDVKSMFTPELVKSLMESSKGEAEEVLRKKLALQALAEQEKIEVEGKEIEEKFNNVKEELSGEKNIDFQKVREAITDDILEDKLIQWLEENSKIKEINPDNNEKKSKDSSESKKSKQKHEKS